MIGRREFITLLGGAAARGRSRRGRSRRGKLPTIGFLGASLGVVGADGPLHLYSGCTNSVGSRVAPS